jgi:hypothetical protein
VFFHVKGKGNKNARVLARGQSVKYTQGQNHGGACAENVDLIAGGRDGRVAAAYLSADSLQGGSKVEGTHQAYMHTVQAAAAGSHADRGDISAHAGQDVQPWCRVPGDTGQTVEAGTPSTPSRPPRVPEPRPKQEPGDRLEYKIDFILKFKDVCRDTEHGQVVRHNVNLHVPCCLGAACTPQVTRPVRVWTCQECGIQGQSQNTTADMCSVRRYF